MHITLNQQPQPVPPGWEDEPLLWLLREPLGLTGTRFGCGM
ncbi:MAG: (2Fe-2S)-binding protein, partial [Acidovorax sp.]|nr:(2Fe-2S)-binding protein [Acidovorax sp.]